MRIDLPQCNFKNCRHCSDGNCIDKNKYLNCEYTHVNSVKEMIIRNEKWNEIDNPKKNGNYFALVFDEWTSRTFLGKLEWDGTMWVVGKDCKVLAWKDFSEI